MKVQEKTSDVLIFLIPILYVVAIIFGLLGSGFTGIFVAMAITGIQLFLGLIQGDEIPKKSFWILVVGFLIIHAGGMIGMIYYHNIYGNTAPDFLLLGMHPSWFYYIVVYWMGSALYQAIAFILLKDVWLSQARWDDFVDKANKYKIENNNITEPGEV